MSSTPQDMANQLAGNQAGMAELRSRLLFVLFALLVYRVGTHIPVPGIDPNQLAALFNQNQGGILELFNMFSGGAWERMSILALGVIPYITASIIMNLLTMMYPTFQQWRKEGDAGRRRITKVTRYLTLGIASVQSVSLTVTLANQGLAFDANFTFYFVSTLTLITGSIFMMWLGEQITERGIGNGISMIILSSIIAGLPSAIGGTLELVNTGEMSPALALVLIFLVLAVTYFVVFMERGQRRITVNYAKRQQGRKMYAGQTSHLPFKINMSGVIPPIFASSIILFPATIATWFGSSEGMEWLQTLAAKLAPGQPIYIMIYASLIIFFCFFYTALVFNSRDTSDNLKKSGGFIPGIRAGHQTAEYIDKVLTRLTFWGAMYITAVCLLPEFMILYARVPFYFGGTSLLIIVVVTMDFMAQLQAHMMSHQYDGLLKKANLSGYGRTGQIR